MDGRAELATLLDLLRCGDTLMVTRLDRVARSVADLEKIASALKQKGAFLCATEQPSILPPPREQRSSKG